MKRSTNIIKFLPSLLFSLLLIGLWEFAGRQEWLPKFIIPLPSEIVQALGSDLPNLMHHAKYTFLQAFLGLVIGTLLGIILAVFMDRLPWVKQTLYPLLIVLQTIPTIALAPVLLLWLGYDMLPKIVLIVIYAFFPVVINLLTGFSQVDRDALRLVRLMGATYWQELQHVKIPASLPYLFSALRLNVSYAFISSVVAEFLGGFKGLGVYMTQSKSVFAYDKMFAVILVITTISLMSMAGLRWLERLVLKW